MFYRYNCWHFSESRCKADWKEMMHEEKAGGEGPEGEVSVKHLKYCL